MSQQDRNQISTSVFSDVSDIHKIVASANMGIWRIELMDQEEPRMYVDDTMKRLLGVNEEEHSPETTYMDWYQNIVPSALESVLASVGRMKDGYYDENTYQWKHPLKGIRYVRCGGTSQKVDGGYILSGYHYDVDEIVRRELKQAEALQSALKDKAEYYETLETLEGIFYSLHVIDLVNDTVIEFNSNTDVRQIVNHEQGAVHMMRQVMSALTLDAYREKALAFTDLTTLPDRLKDKKIISNQFVGTNTGWFLASFIAMERDEEGRATKVIYTTRVIDEEKKAEEQLIRKSQTDELTGLYNRRAYEEDIYTHNDQPLDNEFIYVSMDVNGLKLINDTKGHMAGDELIIGSCQCMKKCLGQYGKLYRIGGDEFVAIMTCSEQKLQELLADFEQTIAGWTGKLVDRLSISYGYVSKEEKPTFSIRQLSSVAEQRMYASKDAHYKKTGLDRRGQKDAHKALCDLYAKILKINLTDDSYQIVNMDISEKTKENGYAESLSEWLVSFGQAGNVHPDDLEVYLRETDIQYLRSYFKGGDKTSLHIFYRRKFENGFKRVMMEMIPAHDYSDESQNLFLYVKNIDK